MCQDAEDTLEPFRFFRTVHAFAKEGRRVGPGATSELAEDLFGFKGVLYLPAEPIGIPLPPGALAALLVTEEELAVAKSSGVSRVASLLGHRDKRYPYPPWSEPGRNRVS